MSLEKDERPGLVCLSELSLSARSLVSSSHSARSFDAKSTSSVSTSADEENVRTTTPRVARPARRVPPRNRTYKTEFLSSSAASSLSPLSSSSSSSSSSTSSHSGGDGGDGGNSRRRQPPRRSISQRFERRPVLLIPSNEFDNDDSGESTWNLVAYGTVYFIEYCMF